MSERPNGPEGPQQVGPQTTSMVDLVIDWQRAFRLPGVASTEMMMRISMQQMQRQLTYLRAAGETMAGVGRVNAKFIQRFSSEAVADWNKAAKRAAGCASEAQPQA
jgi:hypothetical protein